MIQQKNKKSLYEIRSELMNISMETQRLSKIRWIKFISIIIKLKKIILTETKGDNNILENIAKKLDRLADDLSNITENNIYSGSNCTKNMKYKQIFIFSEFFSDVIKEFSNTFNSMGFITHIYCKNTNKDDNRHISKLSFKQFKSLITEKTTCIFETNCSGFEEYIELVQKYNVEMISINFTEVNNNVEIQENLKSRKISNNMVCFGSIEEKWISYCNDLMKNTTENKIKNFPSISIIILNYNNKDCIFRCVDSLIRYNDYGYEIIVVDNGSVDGSYEMLKKYEKSIKLMQNSKNGCSSGRNLGVSVVENDYIVFLDSDQWIIGENWLDCALEIMKKNLLIGAISWNAGWFENSSIIGPNVDNYDNRALFNENLYRTDVNYLATSGFIISKKLFEKLGGFDEQFDPTCFEDTDISLKVLNEGFEIAYTPYMYICHEPHQTTKDGTKAHKRLIEKNGKYFKDKWTKLNAELLKSRLP